MRSTTTCQPQAICSFWRAYASGSAPQKRPRRQRRLKDAGAVKTVDLSGDPLAHTQALFGFLRSGDEIQSDAKSFFACAREPWPCRSDVGGHGNASFEPRKTGHFHPEGNSHSLGLRQALINRRLHVGAGALGLPGALEVRIEIDADESLVAQAVYRHAVPRRPDAMAGVGFKGTVMDFLRKRDRGFDDDV